MRLLVITQKVDQGDDVLGFFPEWLRRLAGQVEQLEVVCLFERAHNLPQNVRVHSLGKERGVSKLTYLTRLYRFVFGLQYDAVLVHMNEEYVLLAGFWWRLLGKKVVLWRNHKMGSWRTRLAVMLSSTVCYTSPSAFVANYRNAVRMPVGIDTDFFVPPPAPAPAERVLFLGRLDPVKKVAEFVEALTKVTAPFHADLFGSPTRAGSDYAAHIAESARPLVASGKLALHSGIPFTQTPEVYRAHGLYVNLTPSGSFDKTIGEAMASGCLVVCANEALRGVLSEYALVAGAADAALAIDRTLTLGAAEREQLVRTGRAYIEREHSLTLLVTKLAALFV